MLVSRQSAEIESSDERRSVDGEFVPRLGGTIID
jgi:hypothetical protein